MSRERYLRVDEVARMMGYRPSTIRKKLLRREIGFHKVGRIVVIPESEVTRLLGEFHKPIRTTE